MRWICNYDPTFLNKSQPGSHLNKKIGDRMHKLVRLREKKFSKLRTLQKKFSKINDVGIHLTFCETNNPKRNSTLFLG